MSPAQPEPAGLKREIGLFGATALGIGAIIGSGIFVVTGIVAGIAGPAMIISVLIAGIIALFSALSVAELSVYIPEEGGTYAYAQQLISPFAGFIRRLDLDFFQYLCRGCRIAGICPLFCNPVSRYPGKINRGNNLPDLYRHKLYRAERIDPSQQFTRFAQGAHSPLLYSVWPGIFQR